MKLIRGLNNLASPLDSCIMTIGNFDGVHLGHQTVIKQVKQLAKEKNKASLVMIFEPQPLEFFAPQKAPKRLYRLREKINAIAALGIDYLFCVPFDQTFSQLSAEQFVLDYLVTALNVHHLVVGDDFCFGKGRSGNYQLLQKMALEHQFTVQNTRTFVAQNERVSSTMIRQLIADNDFVQAGQLLGRPYALYGKVVHGQKLGRDLGFPTINLRIGQVAMVVEGIFAVRVKGLDNDGSALNYQGVASIGTRPTVNGDDVLLEIYILDFNQQVYGKTVCIEFLQRIRKEEKFISIEVLIEHIKQDVKHAKAFFKTLDDSSVL